MNGVGFEILARTPINPFRAYQNDVIKNSAVVMNAIVERVHCNCVFYLLRVASTEKGITISMSKSLSLKMYPFRSWYMGTSIAEGMLWAKYQN